MFVAQTIAYIDYSILSFRHNEIYRVNQDICFEAGECVRKLLTGRDSRKSRAHMRFVRLQEIMNWGMKKLL